MSARPWTRIPLLKWAGVIVAVGLITYTLDFETSVLTDPELRGRAWQRVANFAAAFSSPDLSAAMLERAWQLTRETLATALMGTALGAALGFVLALMASRTLVSPPGAQRAAGPWARVQALGARVLVEGTRMLLDVLRGVPDFAWALLILTVPGPGAVTGVLAIAVGVAGSLGKIYSELWDSAPVRSHETVRACGGGRTALWAYGLQPLTGRSMLSYTLLRGECSIRNASVIGVVGGGGLGGELFLEFGVGHFSQVVTLLLCMLLLTAGADALSNLLRRQLRAGSPGTTRGSGMSAQLRRRVYALVGVAGVLGWSALHLRPAVARARGELARVDWAWVTGELSRLAQPNFAVLGRAETAQATWTPIALAAVATVFATLCAGLLAYPASATFARKAHLFLPVPRRHLSVFAGNIIVLLTRGTVLVLRAIPDVAWLLLLSTFFLPGALAAAVAIGLHSLGILARVFVESVDNLAPADLQVAGLSSKVTTFAYGALPRCQPEWGTYAIFQFESNVRAGVVLGIVGIGGIGDLFHTSVSHWELEHASAYLLVIVAMTTITDRTSRWLNAKRARGA